MRKRVYLSILALTLFCVFCSGVALAGQKEEAFDLVKKGVEFIKTNGVEKAKDAFATDEFKKDDLYLFAYNYDIVCVAQGAKPELVGKNLSKFKTPEGEYLLQNILKLAKNGGGWYQYRWMHPYKKKLMTKESYILPIEGMDIFVGCGYWAE